MEPLLVVKRRSKWPLVEIGNAVLYVLKNGCVWWDVPSNLPPWGTATGALTSGKPTVPGHG